MPTEIRVRGVGESKIPSHTLCLVCKEIVDFAGCAVICDDVETFVVHVQNQILAL